MPTYRPLAFCVDGDALTPTLPLIALLLMCLFGCADMPDGTARLIEWRVIQGQKALNELCDTVTPGTSMKAQFARKPAVAVDGCYRMESQICVIYTLAEADNDTLGHEARHCFVGNWH